MSAAITQTPVLGISRGTQTKNKKCEQTALSAIEFVRRRWQRREHDDDVQQLAKWNHQLGVN